MNWQVTSNVSGGHAFAPAQYQLYENAAKALGEAARSLNISGVAFGVLVVQLGMRQYVMPAVSAATQPMSPCLSADHIALPYSQLAGQCEAHARQCMAIAAELTQMSLLIMRAQSLYSQADDASRRVLNETLQLTIRSFPRESFAAGALISGLGYLFGSIKEGKSNGIYLLDSLDWAQEGIMGAAGAAISGTGPLRGLLKTDEVNAAAGIIAKGSGLGYNLWQGNELTVTQVQSKAPVVRESHSVSESLENLRRLAEERLGKADLDSGLEYGTIAISKYRRKDGSNAWLVTIPGTDGQPDSPFGWPQNVELMSSDPDQRMQADSARMVAQAMKQAGIGKDEPVAMIGHSQGGIVAATLASDLKDDYTIEHVVTAGSPVANHPIAQSTWVTSIEMDDELVAALDGAANPSTENWLTVRGTLSQIERDADASFTGTPVEDAPEGKEITHWLKYHQAAYQNATDMGSIPLETHERHFQEVIDGELEEVTYWQGRMSH